MVELYFLLIVDYNCGLFGAFFNLNELNTFFSFVFFTAFCMFTFKKYEDKHYLDALEFVNNNQDVINGHF